jgi:hypothetical protein
MQDNQSLWADVQLVSVNLGCQNMGPVVFENPGCEGEILIYMINDIPFRGELPEASEGGQISKKKTNGKPGKTNLLS